MRQFARVLDSEEIVEHVVFATDERNYDIIAVNMDLKTRKTEGRKGKV